MSENTIQSLAQKKLWKAEGPSVFQLIQPPTVGFSKVALMYPGLVHSGIAVFQKGHYAYQFLSEQDSISWMTFLIEQDRRGPQYIQSKIGQWQSLEHGLASLMQYLDMHDVTRLDDVALNKIFHEFYDVLVDVWAFPIVLEGSGLYFDTVLQSRVRDQTPLPEDETSILLSELVVSDEMSFVQAEHVSLLRIASMFLNARVPESASLAELRSGYPEVFSKLEHHQRQFYWIRNNYCDVRVIEIEEFFDTVKQYIANITYQQIACEIATHTDVSHKQHRRKQLLSKLSLSSALTREIEIYALFSWWTDEKKRINLISDHYLALLIAEVSRRMEVDRDDGYFLLNEDIDIFLSNGQRPDMDLIIERKTGMSMIISDTNTLEIEYGSSALDRFQVLFDAVHQDLDLPNDVLPGYVASRGSDENMQISGTVCVVMDVHRDRFEPGCILVTSMTRPEFVPLMKQAKAIVTDEGGVTSHAAIVSRELTVPCIIGTKHATRVFESGDRVEIDLREGTVKKLTTDN